MNKILALHPKCLNKSVALHPNCFNKVLLHTQNLWTKLLLSTQNLWIKALLCTTNFWTQSGDQKKDPLHGLFSYRLLAGAALCSVIAQQVYYSTMLAQQGMWWLTISVPVLLLGHHLQSNGQNDYTIAHCLHLKCLNKSLTSPKKEKSCFGSKIFEQCGCVAPKHFQQKSSFAA